jgi:hypothetical protein
MSKFGHLQLIHCNVRAQRNLWGHMHQKGASFGQNQGHISKVPSVLSFYDSKRNYQI